VNKYRIFLIPVMILSFFFSLFSTGHCCDKKKDCVIAIDAGHSRKRPGAVSARGVGEFHFNRNLAELLSRELVQHGFSQAFLINEKNRNISLTDRTMTANKRKADLFISIHHDSVQPRYLSSWTYKGKRQRHCDLFQGYSIFCSEKNGKPEESLAFAHLLGEELLGNGFRPTLHHAEKTEGENRDLLDRKKGIYRFDDLIVLKKTDMPAVLLECGIILNREEEILLSNAAYQKKLVLSVIRAVEKFVTCPN